MTKRITAAIDFIARRATGRPRRLGIGARVANAFVGVASLTLIASVVAFFSFEFINRGLERIEKEGIPVSTHALVLARRAAEYSAISSALLSADDADALRHAIDELHEKYAEVTATLESFGRLERDVVRAANVVALKHNIDLVASSMNRAVLSIAERLEATAERQRITTAAAGAHRSVIEILAPMIDDGAFELATGIGGPGRPRGKAGIGSTAPLRRERLESRLQALFELRFESGNVLAILNEASLAPSVENLPPLRDQLIAANYRASKSAGLLAGTPAGSGLRSALGTLLAFAEGADGLVEARQKELSIIADGWKHVAAVHTWTAVLAADVQLAVDYAGLTTAGAVAESRSAIGRSKTVLIFLVLASLGSAMLFAWILVGKGLVERLARLNRAMLALAEGNLEVQVPHGGHDELTRMAAAVEVFKSNAIEARDLEVAKERARLTDLARREASFRLMFESNPVPMWLYDLETLRFLSINEAAVTHYGYSREQFLAMTVLDIRPAECREAVAEYLQATRGKHHGEEPWRHLKSNGEQIDVAVYSKALRHHERRAALVAVIDITERKRAEMRVSHMAHHDALTDLPNRVLFRERLDLALTRARRDEGTAVLCLDLDRFKFVNDTLGHSIGDALLKMVGERMQGCVRASDTVARLGGDEFAVVEVGVLRPADASALALRILEAVGAPCEIDGHKLVIATSIGIAIAPGDGTTAEQLLKHADLALYRAKSDGRGTYRFFEPEMDARMHERRSLELDLRQALVNGEFELHYQPLVNLVSNTVTGFEALIRWSHPRRGRVSPADFIPLAEDTGLIVPIGEWVLRHACAEAATWPAHVKVAVNLSAVQFKTGHLVQVVFNALAASGLQAGRLELEITESVLLLDNDATLTTLHQLRDLGARISLDDFGTGYSSLSYLHSFPFDKIKIDRAFIKDLSDEKDSVAILHAIAGLGRSLNIATTAEGVETEAQLAIVRSEGCTEMQGYLFSPPTTAEKLGRFFEPEPRQRIAAA